MNFCFSGGAEGADCKWGKTAELAGHTVVHYSFQGHRGGTQKHLHVLTEEQLLEADLHLKLANKTLNRKFPTRNHNVNSLLRRNFWQVRDSDSLYAIAHFEPDGHVAGGTAWACSMFANIQAKNMYMFDQYRKQWYWFNYFANGWVDLPADEVPTPSGRYTAIGSRALTPSGASAIDNLYKNNSTF